MSTFQEQLDSLKDLGQHQQARIQTVKQIEAVTNRPLVVYAANTRRGGFNVPNSIDDSDITGFSDLIEGIQGPALDVFVHSPGGSAEATERIVNLLRANFSSIRFLIPNAAYSAATMLSLCGDTILMDDRSTLGPIDPQIGIVTPQGLTFVPVDDILSAFEKVRGLIKNEPESLGAFLPLLQNYDLHIFEACENAKKLAHTLAVTWLKEYMLRGSADREEKAPFIADKLSSHKDNLSHGRTIGIKKAQELGLAIIDLRTMPKPELRQLLWKLYCLIDIYFDRTPAVKLFENSRGTSWAKNFMEQQVVIPGFPPAAQPRAPQAPAPKPSPLQVEGIAQGVRAYLYALFA